MHTVIVGGGFAGVKTALELSKRHIGKVTLISDHSYFLHHATLYATATGKSVEESVIPLRQIFVNYPNVEIIQDSVTALDPHRRLIRGQSKDYHYDKLVLALGSVTNFFNIKGLKQHAYGIKTLKEVEAFHDHIHDEVVNQKLDSTYFVIGGGPTGVELAGALNEYLKTIKMLYRLPRSSARITLVEATSRLLPHASKTASTRVANQLKKQGIDILLDHKVTGLTKTTVTIEDKAYPTTTAVWTSGVANNPFYQHNEHYFHLASNGKVNVNPYLEAMEHVYVIGDNNTVKRSGMAWPALHQAKHVAKNITRLASGRQQKAFRPKSAPSAIPVGESWAYVEWFNVYVDGRFGSLIRRWIELYGYCQLVPLKVALPIWRAHHLSEVDTSEE